MVHVWTWAYTNRLFFSAFDDKCVNVAITDAHVMKFEMNLRLDTAAAVKTALDQIETMTTPQL